VVKAGAKVVLSGFIGPKAFQALRTVGVTMGQDVDGMTVREAVELFKAGKVSIAEQATKPGHWA
jgi:predicted Fe-Mo cluster-binding NifX family protein